MQQFNKDYFISVQPNILENINLRKVQIDAYTYIGSHFIIDKSKNHAVAILPTGAGKTGVMAIAPFGIAHGRVLIITPQLVIKDHVLDSLDPSSPDNFWLRHNVFNSFQDLPIVVEYDKDTLSEELQQSNIVILNVQKLGTTTKNSLLSKVDPDFFDMIIIDEAHHSPAQTWQDALNYFANAKVLKVTGTPFRTDRKPIEGEVVINYRLGQAMNEGIVKTLKNFVLRPEQMFLTLNNNPNEKYTLDEFRKLKIKESEFVSKAVALSTECNQQIVEASIQELNKKKETSDIPHKIIAVCCSINHAHNVKELYEQTGYEVVIVHSKLPKQEKLEALRKIESHQTDVVIHVSMLGEGYDHPYLSVAAIFRPFRSLAPYAQFIGRILRKLPASETKSIEDNIGVVVAHQELELEELWNEYKQESELCDILKAVQVAEKKEKQLGRKLNQKEDVGTITFEGEIYYNEEYYEYTLAAQKYEKYQREVAEKMEQLKSIFPDAPDNELRRMVHEKTKPVEYNPLLNNPRKYRMTLRNDFAQKVQHDIPATLIVEYDLNPNGNELKELPFGTNVRWVLSKGDNLAIIAVYLNAVLREKFGERGNWTINDYLHATKDLDKIVDHLKTMIESII
ncbi:DEAD/DEAH box helicase [Bacillus pseudomycoides]